MLNLNDIVLFTREEATQLSDRILTDEEWLTIRSEITTNDTMWEVIDDCIKNIIDEVITDEDQQETGATL
jgi:hypothetical protein